MGNKSDKGGKFEREVCRRLSQWWSEGEFEDLFWRNRILKTRGAKAAEKQLGDITAVRLEGAVLTDTLCIECKSGYSRKTVKPKDQEKGKTRNIPWDLLDCIDGKKDTVARPQIVDFWEQVQEEADRSKRHPLLIFKRDFHTEVVAMEGILFSMLSLAGADLFNLPHIELTIEGCPKLTFFCIQDFFEAVSPAHIRLLRRAKEAANDH